MKKTLISLLLAVLVPAAASAATFEGKVTMKMSGPKGAPSALTFSVKEGFSRTDLGGAGGQNAAVIIDAAKQEMTMLMLDQKMYMTQATPKPTAATAGATESAAGSSFEITTTKEKILGYDCVKYITKSKEGTSEMWVTDQLGTFLGFGAPPSSGGRRGPGGGAPAPQGWEAAIAGKDVFPLRVVTTDGAKEIFRLEATKVEKVSIPAAAFYPPSDFQNLSAMLKGMGMPDGIPGMPGGMPLPGGK